MKKLNLKELELKLPKIDENYSKILLGGSYDDAYGGYDLKTPYFDLDPNPLDYDNSLDLDVSHDGYQDDGSYQDEGQTGGNNTGSGSSTVPVFTVPATLLDGMNLSNNTLYINTPAGEFTDQLNFVLQSNSVIESVLKNVNLRQVALTIGLQNMSSGTGAATHDYLYPNYVINFNSNFAQQDGWQWAPSGTTDGFDLSFIANMGGITENMREVMYLTHVTLHESMHLKHYNNLANALEHIGADPSNMMANVTSDQLGLARGWLLNNGYTQDFVDIFITTTPNASGNGSTFSHNQNAAAASHLFMEDSIEIQQVFNNAVFEVLEDMLQLQNTKNNMESWLQELQNNAQQYGDETNTDGSTPNGPNWPQLYQNQLDQYDLFIEQYGHLFGQ
ncbi:hypothetical protein ACFSX9_13570 [Flavobacterium ardleyense]|uniref:Uncharacterized protein n=1 Tax=Flavobacterium ardleyense TaxID=2038737 RepID=A0ABW5ZBC0_9FLAO